MKFHTLDDFDFKDKTVLVRVDINSPWDDEKKKIMDNERIREHAKTVKELSDKNAKVVILAHQGRKGDPDFIHLDQHAVLLSEHVGKNVEFVDDVIGEKAVERIKSLQSGDILLLDNVRFLDEESLELSADEHAKSQLVTILASLFDYFVSDGFSVAHRSHASVVGFSKVLPSVAGRCMEKELLALEKAFDTNGENVFILGGAKVEECLGIMKYLLKNNPEAIEHVLTTGVLSELFLLSKRVELGKNTNEFLIKKDYLKFVPELKDLLEEYKKKIEVPVDVAIEVAGERKELQVKKLPVEQQIMDIGKKTVEKYSKIIKKADVIVVKGPAGVYEKNNFDIGTKMLLENVAKSKAFSLIGGGDTTTAMEKIGIDKKEFSYVSLGGGALITYLSGKAMPGIDVLKI
jgi:phosphoglycerate kinase